MESKIKYIINTVNKLPGYKDTIFGLTENQIENNF